jgi:hypothetical protein
MRFVSQNTLPPVPGSPLRMRRVLQWPASGQGSGVGLPAPSGLPLAPCASSLQPTKPSEPIQPITPRQPHNLTLCVCLVPMLCALLVLSLWKDALWRTPCALCLTAHQSQRDPGSRSSSRDGIADAGYSLFGLLAMAEGAQAEIAFAGGAETGAGSAYHMGLRE